MTTRQDETKVLERCAVPQIPYYFQEMYCGMCNKTCRIFGESFGRTIEGRCKRYETWLKTKEEEA